MAHTLMTVAQAAATLGVSQVWVRKQIYTDRLPAYGYTDQGRLVLRQHLLRPPKQLFVKQSDLDAWQRTRGHKGRPKGSKAKHPRKPASQA